MSHSYLHSTDGHLTRIVGEWANTPPGSQASDPTGLVHFGHAMLVTSISWLIDAVYLATHLVLAPLYAACVR